MSHIPTTQTNVYIEKPEKFKDNFGKIFIEVIPWIYNMDL